MSNPIEVLLVEDNPGDIRLIAEALQGRGQRVNLNVVGDGEAALAYLKQTGEYATATRPALILLDLNMPRISGHEVLRTIKTDANLRAIPVVVLTISRAAEDIQRSYTQGANCYIPKPFDLNKFNDVVEMIEKFWLNIVELP